MFFYAQISAHRQQPWQNAALYWTCSDTVARLCFLYPPSSLSVCVRIPPSPLGLADQNQSLHLNHNLVAMTSKAFHQMVHSLSKLCASETVFREKRARFEHSEVTSTSCCVKCWWNKRLSARLSTNKEQCDILGFWQLVMFCSCNSFHEIHYCVW